MYKVPTLPTFQAYVDEINQYLRQVTNTGNESEEEYNKSIVMLIELTKAAKVKMIEEKRDKTALDDIMQAITSLQLQAHK